MAVVKREREKRKGKKGKKKKRLAVSMSTQARVATPDEALSATSTNFFNEDSQQEPKIDSLNIAEMKNKKKKYTDKKRKTPYLQDQQHISSINGGKHS